MSVVVARPRVAVIVEKSTAFGRGLFLGIGRFLRGGGERWDARMWTRHDQAPPWDEAFDGAVGYINAPPLVDWVREHAAAAVSGSASQRTLPMPRVLNDDVAIGRLAAEHLLGRGHRNLLYAGLSHRQYSRDRLAGFQAAVRRAGVRAEACSDQAADIAAALAGATPPLGVMAAGDRAAAMVLDACLGLGLSVPEGVAIVGVDDDEMLCETAAVPLSSVRPDAERVGYEAAALLDRLMAGEPPPNPTRPLRVPPLGVTTRRSTAHFAVDDAVVARALQWIQLHARERIGVPEMAEAVGLSRSAVERRFRQCLDQTPYAAILHARVGHAKTLLVNTDWSMQQIADAAGFGSAKMFSTTFRGHVGHPPTAYRRHHRPNADPS